MSATPPGTEPPPGRRTSATRTSLGLLSFAVGVVMLLAGVLQRHDGQLSWGGRSEPMRTLSREADPERFDRVTYGLIAGGTLLLAGGLVVAWTAAGRSRPTPV